MRTLALLPFLVRSPRSLLAPFIPHAARLVAVNPNPKPTENAKLTRDCAQARPAKTRHCASLHQNPSLGCLHAEPWSCGHLALLAVSSVKESLLPLNPFPKHFSSKSCLTKTIPLQLETVGGSVNFKVFLWRRVFSNADVKGNR